MVRILIVAALAMGCTSEASKSRPAAKPIDDTPTEKSISVQAEKPSTSSPEALAAIDKLLNAHTQDNIAALAAFRNCIVRRSGEMEQGGPTISVDCVDRFSWPERYRSDWQMMIPMIIFAVGDSVRLHTQKHAEPELVGPALTTSNLEDIRAQWMTILVPLLDRSKFIASTVKDLPDNFHGVRVWVGQQPPLVLVIDSKTGLLNKVLFEKDGIGRRETWAFKLDGYQVTRGIQLPGKVIFTPGRRAGATWSSVKYEPVDSFPTGTFEKP